ncbi:MAG: acylneuraminate cytidylyltransferase family protein [Pseudomonadales bacterium]|nr:acylneuraminate cytidylyltransferase family protein [Pseudomonadales bacterium]
MLNGKRVLAVTLARGGSKGVPQKNIRNLCGKPLIGFTIDEALKSKYIDFYMVSTDSQEIAEVSRRFGASIPFLRPKEFASDTATSASALIHAVECLKQEGMEFDYIVELMATNPLKTVSDIDGCIEKAILADLPCCVAVHRIWDQHPSRVKKIENGILIDFYPEVPESRRQDLDPPAYIRSGSIYVTKTSFLLDKHARYGSNSTAAYVIPESRVINIDEMDDFRLAELKLSQNQEQA